MDGDQGGGDQEVLRAQVTRCWEADAALRGQAASAACCRSRCTCRGRPGCAHLCSRTAGAFDERSVEVGELFAAHAAVACSAAQRESALERALVARGLVGQAQGILVERSRLTAEQAFATRWSQERNVELSEVARRLVETGELPAAG